MEKQSQFSHSLSHPTRNSLVMKKKDRKSQLFDPKS